MTRSIVLLALLLFASSVTTPAQSTPRSRSMRSVERIDLTTLRPRVRMPRGKRLPRSADPVPRGETIGYTTDAVVPHTVDLAGLRDASDDLILDGHTLVPVDALVPGALAGLDALFVGVVGAPFELSAAQVDVLEGFVLAGGKLILNGEHAGFSDNNLATGGRFGLSYPANRAAGAVDRVVVDDVAVHPITRGPYGDVKAIDGSANAPEAFGSILDPGPYGRGLASFGDGKHALAIIERGRLAPGSGLVIAVPDVNVWLQNYADGDNRALWRNLFSYQGLTVLDFETEDDGVTPLVNGQAVASPPMFGNLVLVNGFGSNNYGTAIFDSDPAGPNAFSSDPDLLVDLGNILILQEDQGQTVPGFFDEPDDAQLGGTMQLDFLQPVQLHSVDLIDVCPGQPLQDVSLTLLDEAGNARDYFVPGGWTSDRFAEGPPGYGTLDLTTLEDQPGHVATASAAEDREFDANGVVRLEVRFSSSGAIDNLALDPDPSAGEPITVELEPIKDNTLIQTATGGVSNGAGTAVFAGRVGFMAGGTARRAVLAFDVAGSVPAGATILDAQLHLNLSNTVSADQDTSLHVLLADWGEGTSNDPGGQGDPSTPGDATWLHTFYPASFWTDPGGDFDPVPSATLQVGNIGPYTWSSPALIADVQGMLDDPATDFGWILIGNEETIQTAKRFDSREVSQVGRRPRLTITYVD